jgi:protein SCO1/2
LIYTSCQYACPLETARLAQVQRLLGDRAGRDLFFYSISIDPEHDTPAVLKAYAEKYNAGPGWLFLTGKKADIDLIARKLGLYSAPDVNRDGHTPYLLVGNESTGQWMRNSAVDNAQILAKRIGEWFDSWQSAPKTVKSYADVPRPVLHAGQREFTNHCGACHTIGHGDHLGPDLLNVTVRRDRGWLTRFIVEPDKVIAEGDPIARSLQARYKEVRMPNLGLSESDAATLVEYIDGQSRAAGARDAAEAGIAAVDAPGAAAADLMPIVTPYLRIQRALHADVLDGIRESARLIVGEAGKLGPQGERIKAAGGGFERAGDLKTARVVMGALSDAILIFIKSFGATTSAGVKVAYCPMAQKYWLQEGLRIQNPFYGNAMSECGRISAEVPSLR